MADKTDCEYSAHAPDIADSALVALTKRKAGPKDDMHALFLISNSHYIYYTLILSVFVIQKPISKLYYTHKRKVTYHLQNKYHPLSVSKT